MRKRLNNKIKSVYHPHGDVVILSGLDENNKQKTVITKEHINQQDWLDEQEYRRDFIKLVEKL